MTTEQRIDRLQTEIELATDARDIAKANLHEAEERLRALRNNIMRLRQNGMEGCRG